MTRHRIPLSFAPSTPSLSARRLKGEQRRDKATKRAWSIVSKKRELAERSSREAWMKTEATALIIVFGLVAHLRVIRGLGTR